MAATKPGAELRRLINKRSLSISDLAKQLNINGTTVWNWTNKGVPAKHRAVMRTLFTDAEIDTFISRPKKPGPKKKDDDLTMKEKISQRLKEREQADRYTLAMNIVKSVLENSTNGRLTKSHLQAIKAVMEAIS
jgi:transcriptional regulator with XRE-family HTH domain